MSDAPGSVSAEPTDTFRLPRIADVVCRMFADARAVYGDDAPAYVWKAVAAAADRYVDDTVRMLVQSSGTFVPFVPRRGRPPTDPALLARFAELRALNWGYKRIAAKTNELCGTEYTGEQIRDLLRKRNENRD